MRLAAKIVGVLVGVVLVTALLIPVVDDNSTDGENTLDVVVIAGQSNAAYIVDYVDVDVVNSEIPQVTEKCYYFGYGPNDAARPINNLNEGKNSNILNLFGMSSGGKWVIGGEEVALASTIASVTHDDVLVINVAIPGQAIEYFTPTQAGGAYAKEMIELALSKIPTTYSVRTVGWMWCQGESDKTTAVADYVASFDLIQAQYAELGFDTCYMVQTKPVDSGNATTAQTQICDTDPDVIMASTAPADFTVANGLLIDGNSLHYSQAGRDIVGEEVGDKIAANISVHLRDGSATYSVLQLVPILVVVALVLGAVGSFISRRD